MAAQPPAATQSLSTTKARWWSDSDEDDPITLEPIRSLTYPPIRLNTTSHLFDPVSLAAYIVSRSKFECPLTRSPLGAEDCCSLDAHLSSNCASVAGASGRYKVAEAFRLHRSVKVSSSSVDQDRIEALQGAAAMALQGLFEYSVWRGGAIQGSEEEGLRVVDDNEIIASASDRWQSENAVGSVMATDSDDQDVFPQLSGALSPPSSKGAIVLEGMKEVVERAAKAKAAEDRVEKAKLRSQRIRAAEFRQERAVEHQRVRSMAEQRIAAMTKEEEGRRRMVENARIEIEKWRTAMFRELEMDEEARKAAPRAPQPTPIPPPAPPPKTETKAPPPEPEVSKEERDR